MIGIYKITNKITNKIYIGQSKDIKRRWTQHKNAAKDIKNSSYFNALYTDFRHYGIENFSFEVIKEFSNYDKKILDYWELYYMKKYDTLINGYNIQASYNQRIYLKDINTNYIHKFCDYLSVEKFLHSNNITSARNLRPFLERAIKNKTIIYNKYEIYF